MAFRYRLLVLTPADLDDPAALLKRIAPSNLAGPQWCEVVWHMERVGARSLLVQEGVRDPDFLEEYEAFYSKQHRPMPRFCTRVHAFKRELADAAADVDAILAFIDAAAADASCYLGFVTVRPLRHAPVGATILVDATDGPTLCKDEFPVHIAGTAFKVVGTPYLQQDNAVGACAQASMWMALRTLRRRLGNSAYSPAELTLSATRYIAQNRVFPGPRALDQFRDDGAVKDSCLLTMLGQRRESFAHRTRNRHGVVPRLLVARPLRKRLSALSKPTLALPEGVCGTMHTWGVSSVG